MTEALTIIKELSELEAGLKWSSSPRILTEMTFLRICTRELVGEDDSISDRIRLLEDRIRHLEDNIKIKVENYRHETHEQEEDKTVAVDAHDAESFNEESFSEWDRVIDELKRAGKMKVYSNLTGTSAVWIDKDTIGIVIPEGEEFRKKAVEKTEDMEAVENEVESSIGRKLTVRINTAKKNEKNENNTDIPDTILNFVKKNGIKLDIVD